MKIEKVMTTDVQTCKPSDTLAVAAQLMWDHDVGCVPVIDEQGTPVGLVTDRDLLMASFFSGKPLNETQVQSVMAHEVHTAHLGQTVTSVEGQMKKYEVRRLPVVDAKGHLRGIISIDDLVLAAGDGRGMPFDEVAATLAAITRPRRART